MSGLFGQFGRHVIAAASAAGRATVAVAMVALQHAQQGAGWRWGTTSFLGTTVPSSNRASACSSITSCSATGRSRTRDAEQQGRQGQGVLVKDDNHGEAEHLGTRLPSSSSRSTSTYKVFGQLILDLHFIVTFVFVYVLSTRRARARPRAQQDRAGQSRHGLNRPPTRRSRRSKYFFVVPLFKKARAFH